MEENKQKDEKKEMKKKRQEMEGDGLQEIILILNGMVPRR